MNIAYTRWGSGPNVVVYTPGIVETRPDGDVSGIAVNIASRVQGLANSQSIFATGAVVNDARAADLLHMKELTPVSQGASLRGIEREVMVYAIP